MTSMLHRTSFPHRLALAMKAEGVARDSRALERWLSVPFSSPYLVYFQAVEARTWLKRKGDASERMTLWT